MAETRRIGELRVSVPAIGGNNFGRRIDEARTREVVRAALDCGITHFDTADVYGDGRSEELLGRSLGGDRDGVVITTKFGWKEPAGGLPHGHPEAVERACAESLRRLGGDRIDLYLLHRPDERTPIGDTLAAMNQLVERGHVREIGCSNFSRAQLQEAAGAARERGLRPFAAVQNEYSLLHRDPETDSLPAAGRLGMAFIPYSPLASGLLSGKYRRGRPAPTGARLAGDGGRPAEETVGEERLATVERLEAFARERGHTLLELALSWLASRPGVASVIAGATSADQVRANVAATSAWELGDDELADLDLLSGAFVPL